MAIPVALQKLYGPDDEEVRCRIESVAARAQRLGIEGAALEFFFAVVAQYEALLATQRSGREAAEATAYYQQLVTDAYRLQVRGFEAQRTRAA